MQFEIYSNIWISSSLNHFWHVIEPSSDTDLLNMSKFDKHFIPDRQRNVMGVIFGNHKILVFIN